MDNTTIYQGQLINPRADLCTRLDMVPQASKPYYFDPSQLSLSSQVYFSQRFPEMNMAFTLSGTDAIALALGKLDLKPDDVVTILTTTQNYYVSGCVTKAIDKFCCWSRAIEPKTKVIYVNHEFGFAYEDLRALKKYNLPIIEDCAYSFTANNAEGSVGAVGDYVIFSLPKFFPMQLGGVLIAKQALPQVISEELRQYIVKQLDEYMSQLDIYSSKRRELYSVYMNYFSKLKDFKPRFELAPYHVPGAFMFHVPETLNLDAMKVFLKRQGIESSIFYGERVYFLPLHQNMTEKDIEYLYAIVDYCYHNLK